MLFLPILQTFNFCYGIGVNFKYMSIAIKNDEVDVIDCQYTNLDGCIFDGGSNQTMSCVMVNYLASRDYKLVSWYFCMCICKYEYFCEGILNLLRTYVSKKTESLHLFSFAIYSIWKKIQLNFDFTNFGLKLNTLLGFVHYNLFLTIYFLFGS